MNVEIGTKPVQFLFWEYTNGIFLAVCPNLVYRKAFLGPLYKEVEYLAKLEQQAKEAGHKRWDHRIKIHRRVGSNRHELFRLLPAMLLVGTTGHGGGAQELGP
jgi:hypothetical protein